MTNDNINLRNMVFEHAFEIDDKKQIYSFKETLDSHKDLEKSESFCNKTLEVQ
ncbi:MAG: hypothetical protein ACLR4C_03195 [Eubacterium ventriosum]